MSYPAEPQSGNVFTRHLGPLPLWAWAGIALLAAILFYLWNKNKQNSQNSAANTPAGVNSSLVPQFVNQTFVDNVPPPAPSMTGDKEPDKDSGGLRGKPIPGKPGFVPTGFETITVTKSGWASTLEGIATREKVPGGVTALAKLNGIPSSAHLHVGQKLKVPISPTEK